MTIPVAFTTKTLLSLVGCLSVATGTSIYAQQAAPVLPHDPGRPYKVWVLCIDRSKSPESREFRRLQLVLQDVVDREVGYNDLVWIVEIGSGLRPTEPFEMPPSSLRRELRILAEDQMTKTKAKIKKAIEEMTQVSGTTDLGTSLDEARALLVKHTDATSRRLVIGTDFVSDLGHGKTSVDPPPTVLKNYTRGVNVDLLVTYPDAGYLRNLRTSPAGLLQQVTTAWMPYFTDDGASSVDVWWVDAVPVKVAPPD